jgi:hypothetical protein
MLLVIKPDLLVVKNKDRSIELDLTGETVEFRLLLDRDILSKDNLEVITP